MGLQADSADPAVGPALDLAEKPAAMPSTATAGLPEAAVTGGDVGDKGNGVPGGEVGDEGNEGDEDEGEEEEEDIDAALYVSFSACIGLFRTVLIDLGYACASICPHTNRVAFFWPHVIPSDPVLCVLV